ncbi:phytanoyl-CoA dioxygenase domain-containing protein 1 [Chlamydoabsidia padenii]|nr:phytanoyl-CoA dioxygenase domain-containing protein 1 [Chlamydoabsidia padenii]
MLTDEQLQQFDRDGFLVIPNYFSLEQAETLKKRADKLLDELSLEGHPMTQFSTGGDSGNKHVGDEYFLDSGDKIRYFFEEGAFNEKGELTRPKEKAINKIGHGLHLLDDVFAPFSVNDNLATIARQIGFVSPKVLQSMLIFKQPYIGGKVPSHQDSTFLYTEPLSATGFWFALEDCTDENGCLWFIPGSHKDVPVTRRFVRDPNGGTTFIGDKEEDVKIDDSKYIRKEVKAGTLVLIHGSVVHKSAPNYSKKSRFIYTFHVIEGNAHYPDNNWLQPTKDAPFTSL